MPSLRSADRLRRREGGLHITAFVDSITYGAGETGASQPKWLNSWPGRLSRILNEHVGMPAGTGIVVPWNTLDTRPGDDPRLGHTGDVTQVAGPGPSDLPRAGVVGRGLWRIGEGGRVTFIPANRSERFAVYVHGVRPSAPAIRVDGEDVALDRDSLLAGADGIEVVRWSTRSGGSRLTVERAADPVVDVWGVEGVTGGVRVSTFARDGIGTELLADDPEDLSAGLPLHVDAARADLAIMLLGANDRRLESGLFTDRTRSAIARVRAAGGEVLLLAPPSFDYSDPLIGYPTVDERVADLRRIAERDAVALLELAPRWGDFATANARGWFADGVHPSDAGLEDIARHVARYLLEVDLTS